MCEDITKYMGDYFSPNTDGVIVSSRVPIVLITEGKEFNNFEIVRKIKRIRCKFYLVGIYDTKISNRFVRIAYN